MGKTKSYKDLAAFQKAHELCLHVYRDTGEFPKNEMEGLALEMRQAAISISSNIVVGYSRKKRREFIEQLNIALSSRAELETMISLSVSLKFLPAEKGEKLTDEAEAVGKLLHKLMASLEK